MAKLNTKMREMETTHEYRVRSFMSNVNKLDEFIHRQTNSGQKYGFGTVKLIKSAARTSSGKRLFSVKNSKYLKNGSYTLSTIRQKLLSSH